MAADDNNGAHVKRTTEETIRRAIDATKSVALMHIDSPKFRSEMTTSYHAGVRYLKTLITPDLIYYVFADSWKAIDFVFIMHDSPRPNENENHLRLDIRRVLECGLALMMHNVYRYIIQTKVGLEVAGNSRGPDVIRLSCKLYTNFGPTKGVVRRFEELPASLMITEIKLQVKPLSY